MVNQRRPPVELDWKISKVLEVYPDLLEVLATTSPAFTKLRNPVIRRVQSRLVTVRQAAGVAGIDAHALLRTLNAAIGHDTAGSDVDVANDAPVAIPDWATFPTIVAAVDARPMIDAGEELFAAIQAASRRVGVGETLSVRSPFDPVPLRDALSRQGFEAITTGSGDDWTTLFHRVRETRAAATSPGARRASPVEHTAELTIDVSELVPPEPMMRILAALEDLPDGGRLIVHHVRRPMHLYPRLDQQGYAHETRELGPNQVEIVIDKGQTPA